MFFSITLLSLFLVASSIVIDATSLGRRNGSRTSTLNFTRIVNKDGTFDIPGRDRARARTITTHQGDPLVPRASSILAFKIDVSYVAIVSIGENPQTEYTLLIDTGSANTWVGNGKPYKKTISSTNTGNAVSVSYGIGGFTGIEWLDTVTLSASLSVKQQSIGVASSSFNFAKSIDGILGVGPVDLTANKVQGVDTVPTVMDNLFSQGAIDEEVLGVCFTPWVGTSGSDGSITFGGVDTTIAASSIMYVFLTTTYPSSNYWGIDLSITYGDDTTLLGKTAGIVDTGTTFLLLATDAYNQYMNSSGATYDGITGLLTISQENYDQLLSLFFVTNNGTLELTRNAQSWPRSKNSDFGGDPNTIYLVIQDLSSASGFGFEFILGYVFLERFCSVYDTTNQRLGFAENEYTYATNN